MATMIQAIRMALHVGEARLGVTDIFGEDVGPPLGGVFTGTQGLKTAWNTPLDERGIVGMAIGLALAGRKPVAEIQFCDYAFNTIDLLEDRRQHLLVERRRLERADGADDAGRRRHPRQHLSLALVRRAGDAHPRLEDRDAVDAARRVRPAAVSAIVDPNPVMFLMPKALLRMKGAPGRGDPGRAGRRQDARRR